MTSNVISEVQLVPTAAIGFADIVGFGLRGVDILRNGATQPYVAIDDFGYNQGWRNIYHERLLCDMAGNNLADIVGFGDSGVFISYNNGDNTFTQPAELALADFGHYAGGWRLDRHVRFAADIRKVGRCDIVGFGNAGVYVSQNNGDRTFSTANLVLNDFGFDQGWQPKKNPRFLAPVTENGLQDIVGFGDKSVFVARNNGDGTFASMEKVLDDFGFVQGWEVGTHPRFLAHLTGKSSVDIIGFKDDGVYVSLNDGNGNFGEASRVVDNFGTKQGWLTSHPRFIANLRDPNHGDIIGFGEAGVYVSFNNGDGTFQPANLVLNDFGGQQGWMRMHPRLVADLTGDGCADIVGFGAFYVFVSINDGKGGFGEPQKLTQDFAYNYDTWDVDDTIRYLVNLQQDSTQVS